MPDAPCQPIHQQPLPPWWAIILPSGGVERVYKSLTPRHVPGVCVIVLTVIAASILAHACFLSLSIRTFPLLYLPLHPLNCARHSFPTKKIHLHFCPFPDIATIFSSTFSHRFPSDAITCWQTCASKSLNAMPCVAASTMPTRSILVPPMAATK